MAPPRSSYPLELWDQLHTMDPKAYPKLTTEEQTMVDREKERVKKARAELNVHLGIVGTAEENDIQIERNDSDLWALKTMTPAQARQYVEDNTATLAAMRRVLKMLAFAVCKLVRERN